ncbi:MAG: tyrosine-protein phosphatase [Eubacterium sp.]|nr:tyrosine-protein phosphatase [Eubacterium sp.]
MADREPVIKNRVYLVGLFIIFFIGILAIPVSSQARITRASTRFFCHRGYAAKYPENSKIAQEMALKKGFIGTNCDAWPTAADETGNFDIAITHDESLITMTDKDKKVTELTADEIKKIRITKGINADKYKDQYIMMLDDILTLTSDYGAFIQIEMKGLWNAGQTELLLDKIKKHSLSSRTVIESMHEKNLKNAVKYAKKKSLEIETNYVVTSKSNDALKRAKKCVRYGFTTVVCYYTLIDEKLTEYCRNNNIKCSAYVPVDIRSGPIVKKLLKYDLYTIGVSDIPWKGEPDIIPLQGAFNARDIGGYSTEDGRKIRKKKLLRSGELSYLTDDDITLLKKTYGLKKVFDLRYPSDVENCPDRQINGVTNINVPPREEGTGASANASDRFGVFSKTITDGVADFRQACIDRSSLMKRTYFEGMISGELALTSYRKVLEELLTLKDDESALIHCVYGKDRTGMMAAVILMALGVPEKTIVNDFAYSNTSAHTAGSDKKIVRRSDMKYIINRIVSTYGSMLEYITDKIGFSKEKIESLREKYLLTNTVS